MKVIRLVLIAVLAATAAFGCKQAQQQTPTPAPQAQPVPAPAPAAAPSKASAPTGDPLTGKVVETMNAGGYTYVSIDSGGGKVTWVALPNTVVKVGQQISCQPGAEMKDFKSKTLNRTFASIIFSGGIR